MVTGFLSATLIVRQYLEPASLKPMRVIIPKNYCRVLNERIVCAGLVRQQILPYDQSVCEVGCKKGELKAWYEIKGSFFTNLRKQAIGKPHFANTM